MHNISERMIQTLALGALALSASLMITPLGHSEDSLLPDRLKESFVAGISGAIGIALLTAKQEDV